MAVKAEKHSATATERKGPSRTTLKVSSSSFKYLNGIKGSL
jgi:hypothetical protein